MASSSSNIKRTILNEDLSNVEFETSEDVEVVPTFDSMGLREELLRGIYAYGKPQNMPRYSAFFAALTMLEEPLSHVRGTRFSSSSLR
jgi:hypothetical protein